VSSTKKTIKKPAKKTAPKIVKAKTKAKPTIIDAPVDRSVPNPGFSPARTTFKIIMEHVYWLGKAARVDDAKRVEQETKEIVRLAKHYASFARNPNEQKIKYSSAVEDYGKNSKAMVNEPDAPEDELELS
jgi:hypothetical protein